MTPTIPLDLFPLDGPASLLRWGRCRRLSYPAAVAAVALAVAGRGGE